MKTSQAVLLLVAGLIVGLCLGGSGTGPNANAQGIPNAVPSSSPRFQISSWGNGTGAYGCHIMDTITGELWQSTGNAKPVKTSEKLK